MGMRKSLSTENFARALVRGTVAAGLMSGLAAVALGGAGTANATCASISGIDLGIGTGCTSSPLSVAVSLGNGTANAQGFLSGAWAIGDSSYAKAQGFLTGAIANGIGNTSPDAIPPQTDVRSEGAASLAYGGGETVVVRTEGSLALAAAQGNSYHARAGQTPTDFGNVALGIGNNFNPDPNILTAVVAGDIAPNGPPSYANLALNVGDDNNVQAKGFCNSVINIFGNRNSLAAIGNLNHATNYFGDDNGVTAANVPDPAANIWQQIGVNLAFNAFGSGNDLRAGSQIAPPPGGPLAIAGVLGVDDQLIRQPDTGATIVTPFESGSGSGGSGPGSNGSGS
jgi:hypothetical protein